MVGRRKRSESLYRDAAATLAAEIRSRRIGLGWTQQTLATRAEIAYGTVRAIETGIVTEPGVFTISSIAGAFGVRLDDLLADTRSAEAEGTARADTGTDQGDR